MELGERHLKESSGEDSEDSCETGQQVSVKMKGLAALLQAVVDLNRKNINQAVCLNLPHRYTPSTVLFPG